MLISTMIQKLELVKKEYGDLSVYFKNDYDTIDPIIGVWHETVDEDQAEMCDLEEGQQIICIG